MLRRGKNHPWNKHQKLPSYSIRWITSNSLKRNTTVSGTGEERISLTNKLGMGDHALLTKGFASELQPLLRLLLGLALKELLSVFSAAWSAKGDDTDKALSTCPQLSFSFISVAKESKEMGTFFGFS